MTFEKFNEIYDKAVTMCRIKCINVNRRQIVSLFRDGSFKLSDESRLKSLKKKNFEYDCCECRCTPDREYMFKLLKEEGGK
jgi:hypothetical protein